MDLQFFHAAGHDEFTNRCAFRDDVTVKCVDYDLRVRFFVSFKGRSKLVSRRFIEFGPSHSTPAFWIL